MSAIKSDSYSDLLGVSSEQQKRTQGKFYKVFITGEPRNQQRIGTMQCMSDFEGGEYFYNNKESFNFIPLFIKRPWEKLAKIKGKNGGEFDQVVAFGWNDDQPKLDDTCKYFYLIAGWALGDDGKVMTHKKDNEANGIKAGDKVLIFFKCNGTRFKAASDLLSDIEKRAKGLPPLSDDINFEKIVVAPRRFIVTVTIGVESTNYGNKQVFKFTPSQTIPDAMVLQIIEFAKGYKEEFEKQFNRSDSVAKSGSAANNSGNAKEQGALPFDNTSKEDSTPAAEAQPQTAPKTFDLGL